jgi:hypothetical protein
MSTPESDAVIKPASVYLSIDNRKRDGAVEFHELWHWINFLEDGQPEGEERWRSYPASAVSQIVWINEGDN